MGLFAVQNRSQPIVSPYMNRTQYRTRSQTTENAVNDMNSQTYTMHSCYKIVVTNIVEKPELQ